jgi:endonuclease/exonuclease/phosphatase family metal-dependent hydrolase
LCDRTGLREELGPAQATWPSFAGLALIPLDHILVTKQLAVTGLDLFSISGSDHRGVAATIRSRS